MKSFILIAGLAAFAAAQESNSWPYGGYQIENAAFNMRYHAEEARVEIAVTMPDGAWFGLVPGQGNMSTGGDMLVFFTDGVEGSSYGDYHSIGYQPP